MTELTFDEVPRAAYHALRLALEEARLPTDDLDHPGRRFFRLSDSDGAIGYIGVEGEGADRLLRSLVVLPGRRGQGHGKVLVKRLEHATSDTCERLHLLTTGAADFFRALGYADGQRASAPSVISGTAQFTSLCPATAAYLVKQIR